MIILTSTVRTCACMCEYCTTSSDSNRTCTRTCAADRVTRIIHVLVLVQQIEWPESYMYSYLCSRSSDSNRTCTRTRAADRVTRIVHVLVLVQTLSGIASRLIDRIWQNEYNNNNNNNNEINHCPWQNKGDSLTKLFSTGRSYPPLSGDEQ